MKISAAMIGNDSTMSAKLVPTSEKCDGAERREQTRGRQAGGIGGAAKQSAREAVERHQVKAVNRPRDQSGPERRHRLTQNVDRIVDQRIEIGLKTGGYDIDIIAMMDRGPDIINVIVAPVPVDILANGIRIDRAGQHAADDDGERHGRNVATCDGRCRFGPTHWLNPEMA